MIGLTNIEKRFGDNLVLKGVTVSIDEGSVTALVGPSGGGKSTLLRCINLLEIPTSGSLRIGEETLAFHPGGKVPAKDIQRIRLQTGMVFQNFQLFPHRTAIENVMEGLVTVLKWPEPRALDPELAQEVVDVLGQLAREGTTMVMATHDLRLASKIAEEVVFLDAGAIVEKGPASVVFDNPERERTKRFIASLRQEEAQKEGGDA
ncbi:MAG: amino acid ABC transporter ATP-binding protein [Mesorhizobium sp.]|uniref:amino acid ABC transporter ATP-binding protein n=1 Tax=Mesorhizobium sp. TaxID=1871066 RepID=UPI000FE834A4|nr:ATP-binding cassette domain-containing protein [Mesorhizobium sp.]RWE11669.1 MAG: amino acid ABC transporter ATP-binding protein [Mesorhizobium sp.]